MTPSVLMASTIAIDARKIQDFGIGTYIRNLIAELAKLDHENRYVLLLPNGLAAEQMTSELPPNFSTTVESAPVYSVREFTAVSRTLRHVGADLYHATHYVLPLRLPCPAVVTIHDLIHLLFPDFLPNRRALLYARTMLHRAGRVAQRVIAVSECTARDLGEHLGIPRERIAVVWNGVSDAFRRDITSTESQAILDKHDVQAGSLLFVGNPKPHKNLDRILKSFALAKQQYPAIPDLVCVGAAAETTDILQRAAALGIAPSVKVLGFVEQEHLPAMYRAAALLVCPGLYEGFGLPVAEAMASGTPVITSKSSALAEVAGEAALLVEPTNTDQIANAILTLLESASERDRLSALGTERAQRFQWRTTAQQTLSVYEQVLAAQEAR